MRVVMKFNFNGLTIKQKTHNNYHLNLPVNQLLATLYFLKKVDAVLLRKAFYGFWSSFEIRAADSSCRKAQRSTGSPGFRWQPTA